MESQHCSRRRARRCPLKDGPTSLLLALTFVIIIIVVLTCPDMATALIIIGLLLGFCAACMAGGGNQGMDLLSGPKASDSGAQQEKYQSIPGNPAPYAAMSLTQAPEDANHYPGAIDIDEYDTEGPNGHRDSTEGDAENAPDGNPYNTNRVSYPPSAAPCIDDEANDAEMDGDELNTYQARSRNDATRVTAGTMNRRRVLDKYLREETEEAEDRIWWGRHEE